MKAVKHEWCKHEMDLYCPKLQTVQFDKNNLQRANDEWHREIYLSDA